MKHSQNGLVQAANDARTLPVAVRIHNHATLPVRKIHDDTLPSHH